VHFLFSLHINISSKNDIIMQYIENERKKQKVRQDNKKMHANRSFNYSRGRPNINLIVRYATHFKNPRAKYFCVMIHLK
jgi:hypothetical protein